MSLETKATVFEAFRYKKNNDLGQFGYVYSGLIAYILFTRTLTDLLENALPVFLILIAGYNAVVLLVKVFTREMPDVWDLIYWTGGTSFFAFGWTLYMYGGIALIGDTFQFLEAFWVNLDPLRNRPQFIVVTGLTTLLAGILFLDFD